MSLFQCERCGCRENTALSAQGFRVMADCFSWAGIEDRKGKLLCSACGPTEYSDGELTEFGKWHGKFDRLFLPLGMFKTNREGNLEHIETCDTDCRKYAVPLWLEYLNENLY